MGEGATRRSSTRGSTEGASELPWEPPVSRRKRLRDVSHGQDGTFTMARLLSSIDGMERLRGMMAAETISAMYDINGNQLKPANPTYSAVP